MTPQQIRVAIEAVIVGALVTLIFAAGFCVQGWRKDGEIAEMQVAWNKLIIAADKARAEAEKRAGLAESNERAYYAAALATYKETVTHDKAISDRTIADLRAGNDRLRVSTSKSAARSCPVPGAAAGAERSDGPSEETLAPAVAARLAERYAAYNALVDQLTLCQETVRARSAPAP